MSDIKIGGSDSTQRGMLLGVLVVVGVLVVGAYFFFHSKTPAPPEAAEQGSTPPPEKPAPSESQPTDDRSGTVASASPSSASPGEESTAVPAPPHASRAPVGRVKTRIAAAASGREDRAGAGTAVPAEAVQPATREEPETVVVGGHKDSDLPSRRVKLGDLDLSTDVGACKALRRIEAAADEVCPDGGDNRQLDRWRVRQQCLDQAVTEAVQATRSARVAAKRSGGC